MAMEPFTIDLPPEDENKEGVFSPNMEDLPPSPGSTETITLNTSDLPGPVRGAFLERPYSGLSDQEYIDEVVVGKVESHMSPLADKDVVVQSPGNCIYASVATGMRIIRPFENTSESMVISRLPHQKSGGLGDIYSYAYQREDLDMRYIGGVEDVVDCTRNGGVVVYGEGHAKTIGGFLVEGNRLLFTVHDSGTSPGRQRSQDKDALEVVRSFQPRGERTAHGFMGSDAIALYPNPLRSESTNDMEGLDITIS